VLGQHTLKPQEKTELKLVFKTTNAPGLFEKIATLVTDAPGQEQIELHMRGTVKEAPGAKIAVQPRRIDVGDLNGGEKKEVTITVMNNGNRPLVITAVTCREKAAVSVSSSSLPLQIAAGEKGTMTLSITAERSDVFSERLYVISNAKNAPASGFVLLLTGRGK